MRFMLDTNVFDAVIAVHDVPDKLNALSKLGTIEIVTTHVQEDELAGIKDDAKREGVLSISRVCVTTAGAVFDTSKFDMATFGNGSEDGCSIEQIDSEKHNHTADALIATTAARDAE